MNYKLKNENGLSLIEVVVSILIISVILISFFSFFIQSKKVNVQANNISDATYTAQAEMEKIFLVSKSVSRNTISTTFDFNNGYTFQQQLTGSCNSTSKTDFSFSNKYIYTKTVDDFLVELEVSILCNYPHLTNLKITVFEQRNGQQISKAIVENAYVWRSN